MSESLELRSIHVRVADLERSVSFYVDRLGLRLAKRVGQNASLTTAEGAPSILTLVEDPFAKAAPRDAAGLFHVALLLPTRSALGSWLRATADGGVEFKGFSDHGVSEAIYLSDPDGNGLEFYADRPRELWPFRNGEIHMVTEPLDVPDLLAASTSHHGPPLAGAKWGHLHLRVVSLERSQDFYADALGVNLVQQLGDSARFLAADGYHHHLGINRWGGVHQPQPPGSLGLIEAEFERTGTDKAALLRDPDNISVRVTPR
jgi:catechol 2,3-dioxygenase